MDFVLGMARWVLWWVSWIVADIAWNRLRTRMNWSPLPGAAVPIGPRERAELAGLVTMVALTTLILGIGDSWRLRGTFFFLVSLGGVMGYLMGRGRMR